MIDHCRRLPQDLSHWRHGQAPCYRVYMYGHAWCYQICQVSAHDIFQGETTESISLSIRLELQHRFVVPANLARFLFFSAVLYRPCVKKGHPNKEKMKLVWHCFSYSFWTPEYFMLPKNIEVFVSFSEKKKFLRCLYMGQKWHFCRTEILLLLVNHSSIDCLLC